MKNISRNFYFVFIYIISGFLYTSSVHANELNIAAANSTCSAIKEAGKLFQQRNDITINYLCKSSGRLAKGLNGSTIIADIYISANRKWIDYMIDNDMVKSENVVSPWGNELVVATQKDSQLEINKWTELTSDKVKKILIGDPGTAPFGRYAKQAMQFTGIWDDVKKKIETRKHITLLAETLAESDPNTVGILFASNINDMHRNIYTVNKSWHPPIRYYMAAIENTEINKNATAFIDFLQGSDAKKIFRSAKFKVDAQ